MLTRRQIIALLGGTGIGAPALHAAIADVWTNERFGTSEEITTEMVRSGEALAGIELTEHSRATLIEGLNRKRESLQKLRATDFGFDQAPAWHFLPLSGVPTEPTPPQRMVTTTLTESIELPPLDREIAFLSAAELSSMIRDRMISSMRLTKIYLNRLKRFNPLLNCVVTLTEELALAQAQRADEELGEGRYRGPLHGIPYGLKDLAAVPGYPTTWGVPQFQDRILQGTATVAARLEEAGAVLVAKLSMGALAMGDKWMDDFTRNPWDAKKGSSGSSAGSASATAAGLVGFSIGTETLGSILSPSGTCGTTGFRPTFGRVSRHGCMPLSWSMDKIGPIARSVEDCALVFAAIHGADGKDVSAHDWPFAWPHTLVPKDLRIGVQVDKGDEGRIPSDLTGKYPVLATLMGMGCEPQLFARPSALEADWILADTIEIESAAAFDTMLQAGDHAGWNAWPSMMSSAHFYSAVDFMRMLRARRALQFEFEAFLADYDILVNAEDWLVANLTGHPNAIVPFGWIEDQESKSRSPGNVKFTGHLNDDARLLAFAQAFQFQVDAHKQRPPLNEQLEEQQQNNSKQGQEEGK